MCLPDGDGDSASNALPLIFAHDAEGTGGDTPVGVWKLYASADGGTTFTEVVNTTLATELAKIAPNGNNLVAAWSIIEGVPGTLVKVGYTRTSGGGTNARATLHLATW